MRSFLLSAAAALTLAACATREDFVSQSNKANQVVEDAHNQILLANVVRAYKRVPMHFTGIQIIKGPIGVGQPTFGFEIPFGPDFKTNIYKFSHSMKADVAQFDFAIYDKQDFMRGITKPIEPKTLQYYIDQGWPLQILLYMFVREVQITDKDSNLARIINYPQNQEQFDGFKKWVGDVSKCRIRLKTRQEVLEDVGPSADLSAVVKDPIKLMAMRKDGYIVQEKKTIEKDGSEVTRHQIVKIAERDLFELRHADMDAECPIPRMDFKISAPAESDSSKISLGNTATTALTPIASALGVGETGLSVPLDKKTETISREQKAESTIFIRSAEAMVYYLGEIMRAKLEGVRQKDGQMKPTVINIDLSDPKYVDKAKSILAGSTPLFAVETDLSRLPQGAAMSVSFDKETYYIPAGETGGRSMHVLSLLTQLVGLNKNANELPQSPTIRFSP